MQQLKGRLSPAATLCGRMCQQGGLSGVVHIGEASTAEHYTGSYTVTPKIASQVLPTARKLMTADLAVLGVPRYDVSNDAGTTVNIAVEL